MYNNTKDDGKVEEFGPLANFIQKTVEIERCLVLYSKYHDAKGNFRGRARANESAVGARVNRQELECKDPRIDAHEGVRPSQIVEREQGTADDVSSENRCS